MGAKGLWVRVGGGGLTCCFWAVFGGGWEGLFFTGGRADFGVLEIRDGLERSRVDCRPAPLFLEYPVAQIGHPARFSLAAAKRMSERRDMGTRTRFRGAWRCGPPAMCLAGSFARIVETSGDGRTSMLE